MFSKKKTDPKIIKQAGRNAFLLVAYVFLIGALLVNGEWLFGPFNRFPLLGMATFLMLFVLSAFVCGLLALGQPAAMYVRGERQEAVRLLGYTGVWLVTFTFLLVVGLTVFG